MWRFFLFFIFLILIIILIISPSIILQPLHKISDWFNPSASYTCSFPNEYGFGCEVVSWDSSTGTTEIKLSQNKYSSIYVDYIYCESEMKGFSLEHYPLNGTYVKTKIDANQSIIIPVRCVDYDTKNKGSYKGHLYLWYFKNISTENRLAMGEITIYPKLE